MEVALLLGGVRATGRVALNVLVGLFDGIAAATNDPKNGNAEVPISDFRLALKRLALSDWKRDP